MKDSLKGAINMPHSSEVSPGQILETSKTMNFLGCGTKPSTT